MATHTDVDSTASKFKNRGGRPPGSQNKAVLVARELAVAVLAKVDEMAIWQKHIRSRDPRISLDALKYLNDRAYGKPAQSVLLGQDKDKPFKVVIEVLGAIGTTTSCDDLPIIDAVETKSLNP